MYYTLHVLVKLANVALKKSASQTSTDGKGAYLAVDGKLDTKGQCSRTEAEKNPSWRIDLGAVSTVYSVNLFTPNRTGRHGICSVLCLCS